MLQENGQELTLTRPSGSAFFDLDNVVVPAENLLGKENNGFEIIMSSKHISLCILTHHRSRQAT
jgi:hypothetical protein